MTNKKRSFGKLALAGALVLSFCSIGAAQTSTTAKPKADPDSEEYYKYSIGLFGGIQTWKLQQSTSNPNTFAPGGAAGVRADQDFKRYIGVEEAWTFYGVNNARFKSVPNPAYDTVGFGSRNGQVFIGPLFYLTPRSSPVRPFFTLGPGFEYFWMTHDAKIQGQAHPAYNAPRLEGRNGPAFIFGGGVKSTVHERFAIRLDVHGVLAENPHFNLSEMPTGPGSLFVKHRGSQLGLQATLGIDFKFGKVAPPPPPEPPKPPVITPPQPKEMNVSVSANPSSVCPGDTATVTATTNAPNPTYQWSINGEQTSTAATLTFGTTGRQPGTYNISVRVNAEGYNPGSGSTTVTVRPYGTPRGTVSASPNEIFVGETSSLSSNFTDDCHGNITTTYSASEGTVSGSTYNSSGVQFDASIHGPQQKSVTITANATGPGGTGTATTTITVKKRADEAKHVGDILFRLNDARVNNCGKRLLLEELKNNYLDKDPTGQVVFIGHVDNNERRTRNLAERRALNAAAVISGGKGRTGRGVCLSYSPTQILVNASDQEGSDFLPYFCEASVKEIGGRLTANDQRAQYRRVEVWFVWPGSNPPPGAAGARDAASQGVTKLGCPK